MDEISLGQRIKKRRIELNLTLQQLSERCGISPQLISDYENERKEPGVKNIKLLCEGLKVYPNYLLMEGDVFSSKINTYGNVLRLYFEALDLSKNDKLEIDVENRRVCIHINSRLLVNSLIQMKPFIDSGNEAMIKSMKSFNINILSNFDIEEDEKVEND